MALGLDLSGSLEKIKRANEYLDALNGEWKHFIESRPYRIVIGNLDHEGWLPFYIVYPDKIAFNATELRFGVIIGDIIHNLRSALDYIVCRLVEKSGAQIGITNQFPIFTNAKCYCEKIWCAGESVGRKDLRGVKHGLQEIYDLQPFLMNIPGISKARHPLALLQTLSNADKHRNITVFIPGVESIVPRVENAQVIEFRDHTAPDAWNPGDQIHILDLRVARPFPPKLHIDTKVIMGGYIVPHGAEKVFSIDHLDSLSESVAMIVNTFKAL